MFFINQVNWELRKVL